MASGGSSISQWKLILTVKNYLTKTLPKTTDDILQKDFSSRLKFSSNVDDTTKDQLSVQPSDVQVAKEKTETAAPDTDEKSTASSLNYYIPFALQFSKQVETKAKKPVWMERKTNFIPKMSIDNRTRYLLNNLGLISDDLVLKKIDDLCLHLKQYPGTMGTAVKCSGIPTILKMCETTENPLVKERSREILALLGYVAPVQGRGIRILSIDGGGIRGLVAISILQDMEKRAGQPIHRLFDYICGVSTGAIIAVLLGCKFLPLNECQSLYYDIGQKIFSNTTIQKTARLVWNSSAYNGDEWSKMLETNIGPMPLMETTWCQNMPKIGIIATHSMGEIIRPFVFRNYALPHHVASQFEGSTSARIWEAVRASAAAPGYFNEFVVGDKVLLDGGVMVNNPTAIAIHEARQLWPDSKIQTVVSVGTGRHVPLTTNQDSGAGWKTRLNAVINSATDTEVVHATMHDLLPFGTYFRFNPYLSESILLDEIRPDKISLMLEDAKMYIRKNEDKVSNAVASLSRSKDYVSRGLDYYNYKKLLWKAKL